MTTSGRASESGVAGVAGDGEREQAVVDDEDMVMCDDDGEEEKERGRDRDRQRQEARSVSARLYLIAAGSVRQIGQAGAGGGGWAGGVWLGGCWEVAGRFSAQRPGSRRLRRPRTHWQLFLGISSARPLC